MKKNKWGWFDCYMGPEMVVLIFSPKKYKKGTDLRSLHRAHLATAVERDLENLQQPLAEDGP